MEDWSSLIKTVGIHQQDVLLSVTVIVEDSQAVSGGFNNILLCSFGTGDIHTQQSCMSSNIPVVNLWSCQTRWERTLWLCNLPLVATPFARSVAVEAKQARTVIHTYLLNLPGASCIFMDR